MKILHINSYYARSGEPTFYKSFFETLLSKGIDISVFVPTPYNIKVTSEEKFGKYSYIVKTHNNRDRYFFFSKQNKIIEEAEKRFQINSFDLIHAHSLFSNGYVANKLHHRFGIPYIVAIRNTDINIFFRFMLHLKKVGIQILRDAENVVFINESYKKNIIEKILPKELKEEISKKSVVIPNGVDKFWLNNKHLAKKAPVHQNLYILTVGQLSKNKNQISVIRAVELLISKGFNVQYTIIGQAIDVGILKKISKYPFVEYIPPQTKEELLPFYRKANVFVLPSKTETFGLVYAEAMTQSLPVIYTRGQGFDLQFEEGTVGYSVESGNAKEISDRILDIITKYDVMSNNCFVLCDKYDWNKISDSFISLYQKSKNP